MRHAFNEINENYLNTEHYNAKMGSQHNAK